MVFKKRLVEKNRSRIKELIEEGLRGEILWRL